MSHRDDEVSGPPWDDEKAVSIVGKVVLVGLSRLDHKGVLLSHQQIHGVVVEADRRRGILLRLAGSCAGEDYRLPPALEAFRPAKPGECCLRSTGEVVTNPDVTFSRETNEPSRGDKPEVIEK